MPASTVTLGLAPGGSSSLSHSASNVGIVAVSRSDRCRWSSSSRVGRVLMASPFAGLRYAE
ncbi:Uncharacterised protein [Mycobacteroides abscessus subsp. abscessus]|nr:Uncharacterised protein [Mycobacteroides abscessus subsp. abscessus]